MSQATAHAPAKTGHPPQLFILFFAEMWERFSYYGMRALLILYMTAEVARNGFGWDDPRAYAVYGAYTALVYLTPFIGGIIADRILGRKKAVTLGGILMAAGHFLMAFEPMWAFYGALGLLISGNGMFKPNISTMVGELYEEGDPRRDGGFTIFYMGINLGAFLAPLVCGWLGETYGWHWGFGAAGVGMVLGQLVFSGYSSKMEKYGNPPDREALASPSFLGLSKEITTYLLVVLSVGIFATAVWYETTNGFLDVVLLIAGAAILGYLFVFSLKEDKVTRERLWVVLVMIFFTTMFWAFFEQAGGSINLFTERNIDRSLFGWQIPTSWGQAFNPFFILAFGIPFSWLWVRLDQMGKEPNTPIKFVLGLLQLGLGFLILAYGASQANASGMVPIIWLILGYMLHTTGELCLSPVGLSLVTKLAPVKIVSMVMGAWFLSNALANKAAAIIGALASAPSDDGGAAVIDPTQTVVEYGSLFQQIGYIAVGVSVLLLILSPLLKKWMHGVH